MFRRTFWFTAGAAAGVWATTKVNRKLRQLTPESLAAQAANKAIEAGHRLKDFALDVRDGMAQREAELDEALGLNAETDSGLPSPKLSASLEQGVPPSRRIAAIENRNNPKYTDRTAYSYNRNEDH
ncbi:DUF6167 family protein [Streptomyces sp. NPDC002896]|uniref:DUF6167 family protein n=1 Tax=Streptomyces sp. NPDC002896 TaxID=3154438 RepID=UPI00331BD334